MAYMRSEAKAEADRLWPKGWPNRNAMIAAFVAGAVWAAPRPAHPTAALNDAPNRPVRHEEWCHMVTGCTEPNHCTCEHDRTPVRPGWE